MADCTSIDVTEVFADGTDFRVGDRRRTDRRAVAGAGFSAGAVVVEFAGCVGG
jgi:hypothetical protein